VARLQFPAGFDFGVATSAFQIEGAWNEDGKGPSIWDTFGHTPGKVAGDVPGDRGADHYHRYKEDVALMKDIGITSYRFSLSWPRLMPEGRGPVNQKGIDFYSRLIDELLAAGIQPNVTLYHWDLPQALEDKGGWSNRDIIGHFADYATLAFSSYGDRVRRWATLNEPISIWVGYAMGVFAPGRTDEKSARQALHHALVSHGRGVEAFRTSGKPGEIGIVFDIWQRHPATDKPEDRAVADRDEDDGFRFFLDPVLKGDYTPIDYLGLNVYSRVVVSAEHYNPRWWVADEKHPGGNFLDNGMEYYPKAVYDAILMARDQYGWKGPIFITENGAADGPNVDNPLDDQERINYVAGFLEWIHKAIADGADVRGYYLWSLMDNFEWAAGYTQKFGIIHLDTETMKRTPKASARWYRDVIVRRGL
jgi:beta-glucosidase